MLKFFILISLYFGLEAKYLTFQEVHRMPKGVEKNYYIWRFITQKSTTKSEAMKIIKEANMINGALKKAYRKKTGLNPPKVSGGSSYYSGDGTKTKVDENLAKKRVQTTKY